MLAPIPWERYSGEKIEDILATYICRLHPYAVRIRPSQGDHGIDVLEELADGTVVVYQIKRFASNLEGSHKRQIKHSFETLMAYLEENGCELHEWHLVLPLDPTTKNLKWFHGLAPDSHFKMVWDGLTIIDGWAAQMPEVADYCLSTNSGWIMDIVRLHLEALDMQSEVGRDQVAQRLFAVQEILEKTDPYYRYGVHLIPEDLCEMEVKELMEASEQHPNLLMTHMYEQPGVGLIQIDVFARSVGLAELHPIQGRITFVPKDEDECRQLDDYVNYGVPIRGCTARIVETSGPFAYSMPKENSEGVLHMLPHEVEQTVPELYLVTEGGSELPLYGMSQTSGSKGTQTVFSDKARIVSMTLRADFGDGITGIIEVTTKEVEREDCSNVRDSLGFLCSAYENGKASVLSGDKVVAVWTLHPNDALTKSINVLYEFASAIVAIGRCAHVRLPFPEFDEMTPAEHAAILSKGILADGKCVVKSWYDASFKMEAQEELSLECPAIIKWLSPERISIAGIECDLGYSENIIVAGSLVQDSGDESFSFLPREAGKDVCITHLLPTRSLATGMVNQVYSTPYQEEAWANTLRLAGYNRRDDSC